MITMDSIHPVSEFSRKPAEYIKRLKETRKPEVLTVNGKAEVVIQDAKAYEEMLELLESIKQISKSVKDIEERKTKPLDEAFSDIKKRLITKYPDANL